jgi:hypothetical protein
MEGPDRLLALLALLLPGGGGLQGQEPPPPLPAADSATVVAAGHCRASPLFAALAGGGYRDLWTTPITVPVARLDELGGGGLTPVRVGGGMTTQTLHLTGADGRRYVFRSVEKVTRQALAEEFWGTPVEAIMRDQLCSFHPSGAPVVARLLEAVGVLHPEPTLVVVPDDPGLGEFRQEFAGMLVLFEERPDDLPNGEEGFAGSRQISQTDDLFDELEDHPLDRVDLRELLKARLVDLLVGDRDRSNNNFLWARLDEEGGGHYWRPVPRDRDQAFVRFDGLIKTLGRSYDPRLVSFDEDYPNIGGLTRNAWDIDRNLLVGLGREEWDRVVEEVRASITDRIIEEAVGRLPAAHYALVGADLEKSLKRRRDNLPAAAEELYRIVFREADIHGTDEDEVAVIAGTESGSLSVSIRSRGSGADASRTPHFQRQFTPGETKELRIYMHGGDDQILLEGSSNPSIPIRIIGGGGEDRVTGSAGGAPVFFYDAGDHSEVEAEGVKWLRREAPRPFSWWVDGEGPLDFGARAWPELALGYDPDRGLTATAGFKRERFGFLAEPYLSRLQMSVGWAFGRSEPILNLRYQRRHVAGGADLLLRARYSGFEVVRFYGLGNQTEETELPDFYKVRQKQLALNASVGFGDGEGKEFSIGPVLRRTASDTVDAVNYVTLLRSYGTGAFLQAGVQATLELDERDRVSYPTRGYHFSAGGSYYPPVLDVEESFGEVHGHVAGFLSPASGNPTLALRVGGKQLWGTFPYSDAAYLGGSQNVRGLREQRFAGEAAVYGSAELRVFLTRFLLLFPTDFGVFGLSDAGRVYAGGQPSGGWHTSVGGGIWLAPVMRSATVHVSIAQSEGRRAFYVGTGFAF